MNQEVSSITKLEEYKKSREKKVEVRDLIKAFDDLLVLNEVNFDIYDGEFLCIVGPTGCGKTTFLNVLAKLLPATEGDILIDGVSADPKKHNIAFVFQEPSCIPWQTVEQNIRFGLEIKRLPANEINKRTEMVMELIGLTRFRNYLPKELSSSLEQRVVIARNFVMQPDIMLMDEPYGQLDVKLRYYLEDELIKTWQELKPTVLFITHNIEEAVYMAERILILSNKPTTIKSEVIVDLPRPRNFADPSFVEVRDHITDLIRWW